MGAVSTGYYQELLRAIGAPVTRDNLRALLAWQRAEGGRATYNPFNTTMPARGATWYNTFGAQGQYHVRNYPDAGTGVDATARTLLSVDAAGRRRYDEILLHLRAGNSGRAVCVAVDASEWGTHGAAREYDALYGLSTSPVEPRRVLRLTSPLTHGSDVRQLQEALAKRGYSPVEIDGFYGRNTVHAVEGFQRAHHLTVDGITGKNTWHALAFA